MKIRRFARMVAFVIMCIAIAAVVNSICYKKLEPISKSVRSLTELKSFWDAELQPIIGDKIVVAKSPYPEINARFDQINSMIVKESGKALSIDMSTNYNWADVRVEASSGIVESNTTRVIELYMPAIADTFDLLKNSGKEKWHEAFVSHVYVLFMHEMEHQTAMHERPTAIDIREESRAWIDTCRYTIAPLAETYHLALLNGDGNFYQAWKLANGNPTNTHWLSAINSRYSEFDRRTNAPK